MASSSKSTCQPGPGDEIADTVEPISSNVLTLPQSLCSVCQKLCRPPDSTVGPEYESNWAPFSGGLKPDCELCQVVKYACEKLAFKAEHTVIRSDHEGT